jgi:SOS-response transcriptional repressor LexA
MAVTFMSAKLSENLNLLMSESRLNAEELSRRISLPASTIKKIRNNSASNPTLSTLSPLAKYFSLTISQLVGDEPFPKERIKGSYKIDPEKLSHIPLISWQEAITWPDIEKKPRLTITSEHEYSKTAYALLVEEDNWDNLTKDTALLIEPTLKIEHRDFVIVYKVGQKVPTLKQILLDEEQMYLKPVTQGYNIAGFTPEHKILGIIVEYKKHLKKIIS